MFIAVTRLTFGEELKSKVLDISERSVPVFRKQKGLKSLRAHLAHDGSHLMTYLEWESKEDHEACMVSPDWGSLNDEWDELLNSGKVIFELNTYDVIA